MCDPLSASCVVCSAVGPASPLIGGICAVGDAAKAAGNSILDSLINMINAAETSLIENAVSLWIKIPSPGISDTANALQSWLLPITILIAVGGLMWQALQMIITRKPQPAAHMLRGIVSVSLWGGIAIIGSNVLLAFSDTFSNWILAQGMQVSTSDTTAQAVAFSAHLNGMLILSATNGGIVLVCECLVIISTVMQLCLLVFRAGAVVILAGLMQFAAAGQFSPATSGWLRKILSWQLSLIFYKVFAAMVYAVGFRLSLSGHGGIITWLSGIAMLLLSLIALPAMMKFFNWSVGAASSGGGSGAAMAGAAMSSGVHALASNRGSAGGATDYARYMSPSSQADRGSDQGATPSPASQLPSLSGGSGGGGSPGGLPSFKGVPGGAAGSAASGGGAATTVSGGAAGAGAAAGPVGAAVMAGKKIVDVGVGTLAKAGSESGAN